MLKIVAAHIIKFLHWLLSKIFNKLEHERNSVSLTWNVLDNLTPQKNRYKGREALKCLYKDGEALFSFMEAEMYRSYSDYGLSGSLSYLEQKWSQCYDFPPDKKEIRQEIGENEIMQDYAVRYTAKNYGIDKDKWQELKCYSESERKQAIVNIIYNAHISDLRNYYGELSRIKRCWLLRRLAKRFFFTQEERLIINFIHK